MIRSGAAIVLLAFLVTSPAIAQENRCSIEGMVGNARYTANYPGALGGPIEYRATAGSTNQISPAFLNAKQTLVPPRHEISVYISTKVLEYSLGPKMFFVVDGQALAEAPMNLFSGIIRVAVPDQVRSSGKPFTAKFQFNHKDETVRFDALADPVSWAQKTLADKQLAGTLPDECLRFVRRTGSGGQAILEAENLTPHSSCTWGVNQ